MTIPASMPVRAVYTGDGVTVNFPVPFIYFANSDGTKQIKVVLADANSENEVVQLENTNFTITDAGAVNGTLTMLVAPTAGYRLTIIYNIPIEQLTDYREFGRLPSTSIETAFDKVTAILKQHQEIIDRCIKVTVSGNQTPEELLATVYDKLDGATKIAAEAITAADNATTAANNATAAVESAEQTLAEVTAYVDAAEKEIDTKVTTAKGEIAGAINQAISDVEAAAIAVAQETIAGAAAEATQTAKTNLDAYVDETVEPSLQSFVDAAQASASSATTSANSATEQASNAAEDASNANESASLAATSAENSEHYAGDSRVWAEGTDAEVTELSGTHSSKIWAEIAKKAASLISGVEIGDIGIAPFGIDETKNTRRYLNGQVISQSLFDEFTTKLKSWQTTRPNLFTTETDWQAEKTSSALGQCGKFVIDDAAGTVRLPCVVNINGLANLAHCGLIKDESLPNITGTVAAQDMRPDLFGGAFTSENVGASNSAYTGLSNQWKANFDASLSSATYQDGAHVQQEAVQYPYFIQVNAYYGGDADESTKKKLNDHIADKNNPHEVTKAQVGLGNVDNTSDLNKPISTATQTALSNKQNTLTSAQMNAVNSGVTSAKIATYDNYATSKQDAISDLSTIRANASNGASAYTTIQGYGDIVTHNAPEFATSSQGALADSALQSGDDISKLNNDAGYITGISSSDVTTALGYTPYNSSNPNGYITSSALTPYALASSLATVATSGLYSDLSGTPTIPTDTSDLTNGAGYITNSALSDYQTKSKLVTSISESSTDEQYPSAKLLYDTVGDIETLLQGLR